MLETLTSICLANRATRPSAGSAAQVSVAKRCPFGRVTNKGEYDP